MVFTVRITTTEDIDTTELDRAALVSDIYIVAERYVLDHLPNPEKWEVSVTG